MQSNDGYEYNNNTAVGYNDESFGVNAKSAKPADPRPRCLRVVKRSNKLLQAAQLPKILICNPRSVYNKVENLKTFIKEEDIDVAILSETWEREDQPLSSVLASPD